MVDTVTGTAGADAALDGVLSVQEVSAIRGSARVMMIFFMCLRLGKEF